MKTTQITGKARVGGRTTAPVRAAVQLAAVASLATFTGCTTYVVHEAPPPVTYVEPATPPPPAPVEPAPTVEVVIHEERDFYEPLTPYGHWEYIGDYGRCWVPARVDRDWRPYTNGHWERTDAGWYWVSDEPWGWATYHYGRWDYDARFGWFWVPQTMWAPAWVTWNRGGGYVGWAPLPPSVSTPDSGIVVVNTTTVPQRGYVFVEERRFLEPVRPTTVVNNTTIINKTINITNVKVVNNTVINEGPRTQDIEQVSGRKIRQVPSRELRDKIEAPVAAANRPSGNQRDVSHTPPQPKGPVTNPTPPTPTPARVDAERQAAERARQEKMDADRKQQADAERARQAAMEKAKQESEQQQRKADVEAARKKQEADAQAREQATRDAQQKQRQSEEARRKQELDRAAQAHTPAPKPAAEQARPSQTNARAQEQSGREAQQKQAQSDKLRHQQETGKASDKKNQAESERRDRQQEKGQSKSKKSTEPQSAPANTNAPGAH